VEEKKNKKTQIAEIFRDKFVPRWHYLVLEDEVCHLRYKTAMEQATQQVLKRVKIPRVLKVGAGSGCLLAMLAAQAGALVWDVEPSKHLSEVAKAIIKNNGFEKDIIVINKDFNEVATPNDMPHKCNILVCEAFDFGCLGEDILSIVQHAHGTLLTEDSIVIPGAATLYAMGVHYGIQEIHSIDMDLVNAYTTKNGYYGIDLLKYHNTYIAKENMTRDVDDVYWPITEPFEIFKFDFNARPQVMEQKKDIVVPAINTGLLTSVVFWFELELLPDIKITTQPFASFNKGSHWLQAIQHIPEINIKEVGCPIPFVAAHNKNSVVFGVKGKELDPAKAEPILNLKIDHVLQEATQQVGELGYQFSRLSNMNEKDLSVAVQSACRIATQACAFGVDPQIAANSALSYFV